MLKLERYHLQGNAAGTVKCATWQKRKHIKRCKKKLKSQDPSCTKHMTHSPSSLYPMDSSCTKHDTFTILLVSNGEFESHMSSMAICDALSTNIILAHRLSIIWSAWCIKGCCGKFRACTVSSRGRTNSNPLLTLHLQAQRANATHVMQGDQHWRNTTGWRQRMKLRISSVKLKTSVIHLYQCYFGWYQAWMLTGNQSARLSISMQQFCLLSP